MEKPTGVIQKIIESLQQVNALDVYSPIEKDIILHNLRAAYMIFLNIPVKEESSGDSVERLFVVEHDTQDVIEPETEQSYEEEVEPEPEQSFEEEVEPEPEQSFEEEIEPEPEQSFEEEIEPEELLIEEKEIEYGIGEEFVIPEELEIEEPPLVEATTVELQPIISPQSEQIPEILEPTLSETFESPLTFEQPTQVRPPLQDDILEFIPDAKPQVSTLFDEMAFPKSEKKSLNDLLTEKKDDQSLGTKFQQTYIPDLTKAIAINEKFTFIRELFRNNGVEFSNAIQKLNECDNIDDAFVFMEELKHQFIWDTTSSAYLTLCDLVRRRFL
jgi:hypothetical protein